MTRRCPRCGRLLADRDPGSREHAANVRKLVAWFVAFPFALGVAATLGVVIGIWVIR